MQYNSTYPDADYPDASYPVAGYPDAAYPDRLRPSGKFVENSIKLSCLEITRLSDQIQYIFMASRTSTQAWSKGLDR